MGNERNKNRAATDKVNTTTQSIKNTLRGKFSTHPTLYAAYTEAMIMVEPSVVERTIGRIICKAALPRIAGFN